MIIGPAHLDRGGPIRVTGYPDGAVTARHPLPPGSAMFLLNLILYSNLLTWVLVAWFLHGSVLAQFRGRGLVDDRWRAFTFALSIVLFMYCVRRLYEPADVWFVTGLTSVFLALGVYALSMAGHR